MTKLKNTKKGMAKKALSISLVAAMLATSNVPVWAAEFSDGSETDVAVDIQNFDDGNTIVESLVEEMPDAVNVLSANGEDMTDRTDFNYVETYCDENGNIGIYGHINKNAGTENEARLQEFDWELIVEGWQTGKESTIAVGHMQDGDKKELNEHAQFITSEGADVYLVLSRNDGVYDFSKKIYVGSVNNFKWDSKGTVIENGGIAYDAGELNLTVKLPENVTGTVTLSAKDGKTLTGEQSVNAGKGQIYVSYKLSKEDVGKIIVATLTTTDGFTTTSEIEVTDAYITLTGTPVIKVADGSAEIRPGVELTVDTSAVKATNDPNFNDFSYQWQYYNIYTKEWEELWGDDNKYTVRTDDYGSQIRVAVFGGVYYNAAKSVFSVPVNVKEADLVEDKVDITINLENGEKVFNATDYEDNKLKRGDITVRYDGTELVAGTDYTLKYDGNDQIGTVKVTVTILPTANTEYSSGTKTATYKLVAPEETDEFVITSGNTSSEYNGKTVTPKVTIKNNFGNGSVIAENTYTVYPVGPNADEYNVYAYVKGQGIASNKDDSQRTHTITPKQTSNHKEDFNLIIPDAVWDASADTVKKNEVADATIQLFDNAISPSDDLMKTEKGNYSITPLNWTEGGVNKAIEITFTNGNYRGTFTVNGKINSRSIAQFQSQFITKIRSKAGARTYNGVLQDVLKEILGTKNGDGSTGCITLSDGTKLYQGRDFDYKIIKGGTDVGAVSIYVEGKGNYDGNMTLSNVYTINKANFREDVTGSGDMAIKYDPSLGDAGATISAYVDSAKAMYAAKIRTSGYKLTEGKDFWLDTVSPISLWNEIAYQPTVAANKVEGHGENGNFITTDESAYKDVVWVRLVEKSFNDSDIQVTVESAEYNGGKLVTPKVKVAYVKNGKEYVINPAYYDVKIIQSAYGQGETGKVNVIAKQDIDRQNYPQLYTGNKMLDYTVGKTNLALGKIVATNGLSTLPSVAYDAEQAATEAGITLAASKYVVKDASGNIVDPKYYTVSFANNKTVGKATITVTGKAPYEGSISSEFNITKNNLPSGTLTLMSDKLSKVYTGEGVELVSGTDYIISGELSKLKEGTDYMVAYDNNINVTNDKSKAAIKIVGINNYAGEVVDYFDITPTMITAANVTLGSAVYQGGVAVRPAVTIAVPGGNVTLTEGTDYTVSYLKPATNAGDQGTVQITYKDNKNINTTDSVKEVNYTVTAMDLKDVTIEPIADQEETGAQVKPAVTVLNGSVKMVEGVDYTVTYGNNTEVGVGTLTIKPVENNKNYTGSQDAVFNIIAAKPEVGRAVISDVVVKGNTVTPVLSGDVDGAVGYDFVISTVEDTTNGRVDISKNVLKTNTNFYYVQPGTYYVYCHAWKRNEDNKKVFGAWSNIYKFEVTAITPSTPTVTKVSRKGSTVTVEFTGSSDAIGYDVVLGAQYKKVNGEKRPVNYGELVKKGVKSNTVVFKNVPAGTYYVGLHAFNRTAEDGKKVFSKWSNAKKVTVK